MKSVQLYGSRKKLLMGLWILMGCFFIALNGMAFMTILDIPIPEPSREVISARIKYSSYNEYSERISDGIDDKIWNRFRQRFGNRLKNIKTENHLQNKSDGGQHAYEALPLPKVSGILTVYTEGLDTVYMALLNGKPLVEKEEIDGFKIIKITEENVFIERNGRQWMIAAPQVRYSLSHNQ